MLSSLCYCCWQQHTIPYTYMALLACNITQQHAYYTYRLMSPLRTLRQLCIEKNRTERILMIYQFLWRCPVMMRLFCMSAVIVGLFWIFCTAEQGNYWWYVYMDVQSRHSYFDVRLYISSGTHRKAYIESSTQYVICFSSEVYRNASTWHNTLFYIQCLRGLV